LAGRKLAVLRKETIPEAGGLTTTTRAHPTPRRIIKGVVRGEMNIYTSTIRLHQILLSAIKEILEHSSM
jgi:hypothetical protein